MDYAATAKNTSAVIRRSGAELKLTRTTAGAYDAASSTVATDTRVHDGFAVQGSYSSRDVDGTNILTGDTRLLVAVHDKDGQPMPRPMPEELVEFAGQNFTVVKSTPLQPGGVPVMWDTQARQ